MREVSIVIEGKPIPQQRHRHNSKRTYNPQAKEKFYNQLLVQKQLKDHILFILPISVSLLFYLSPSLRKKDLRHSSRPDIDNLIKFYLDVMNKIVYQDDSLIYKLNASKYYSNIPRTEISIQEGE